MKKRMLKYLSLILFFLLSNQVYSMKPESDVELISTGLSSLSLQDLPNELLINIVSFYNINCGVINFVRNLCKLRSVSKKFKALLTNDNIKNICKQVGFSQLSDEDEKYLSITQHKKDVDKKSQNEKAVKLLILSGLVNLPDQNGFILMHYLAKQGAANLMKKVIDVGGDVDAKTNLPLRLTPLHLAARYKHLKIINLLLIHDANPHAIAWEKGEPVRPSYYVKGKSHDEIVNYIIDRPSTPISIPTKKYCIKLIRIRILLENAEHRWRQKKNRRDIKHVPNNKIFKLARSCK